MKSAPIFQNYEFLADKADRMFQKMLEKHGGSMSCDEKCSDCCSAVFGVFLIEAAFLKHHFDLLDSEKKKSILQRCYQADRELKKLERILTEFENDPHMISYTMAKNRVRCPLLDNDDKCSIYHCRPITCRVYGIPTSIQGKVRTCGKAKFEAGKQYPIFDLDGAYRDLYTLSCELLDLTGETDIDKASLLLSVSKALTTPVEQLLKEL